MFKARLVQNIFLSCLAAIIFRNSSGPTIKDMQNLTGAMFFISIGSFMPAYMITGMTFQNERPVFLREQANKMYGVVPYYLAKTLTDIPSFIIDPIIATAITFFAIGFTREVEVFMQFALSSILTTLAAVSFSYVISATFQNPTTAL